MFHYIISFMQADGKHFVIVRADSEDEAIEELKLAGFNWEVAEHDHSISLYTPASGIFFIY